MILFFGLVGFAPSADPGLEVVWLKVWLEVSRGYVSHLLHSSGAACLQLVEGYQYGSTVSASASQGQGCPSPGVAQRGEGKSL